MLLGEFQRFSGEVGIGNCMKRKHDKRETDRYRRPIIGRLGNGMLAMGSSVEKIEASTVKDEDNGDKRDI